MAKKKKKVTQADADAAFEKRKEAQMAYRAAAREYKEVMQELRKALVNRKPE